MREASFGPLLVGGAMKPGDEGYQKLGANGYRRRQAKARLKRRGDHICWICGKPIDMSLKFPDPMSWSCDEYQPRSRGGDQYDIDNLREAHLVCNERRGNSMPGEKQTLFKSAIKHSRAW